MTTNAADVQGQGGATTLAPASITSGIAFVVFQRPLPPSKISAMHIQLTPLISLIAGVLILVMPKLLNYIIAIYLIVIGLAGLFNLSAIRLH